MFNYNANVRAEVLCLREQPFLRGNINRVSKSFAALLCFRTANIVIVRRETNWCDAGPKGANNWLYRWLPRMENANRSIYASKSRGRFAFRPASVIDVYYYRRRLLIRYCWSVDWSMVFCVLDPPSCLSLPEFHQINYALVYHENNCDSSID